MGYLANAAQILIEFVFGAVIAVLLLRLLAELWRAPFHNPVCQFLYRSTNPVVAPVRKWVPNWGRLSLAVLLLAWLAEILKLVLICATQGFMPKLAGLLLLAIAELASFLALLYIVLIFAWSLMSMLSLERDHPLVPLVAQLTTPVLRPLQRRLPTLGGIDFSPAVAILILLLTRALLLQPLLDLGLALLR